MPKTRPILSSDKIEYLVSSIREEISLGRLPAIAGDPEVMLQLANSLEALDLLTQAGVFAPLAERLETAIKAALAENEAHDASVMAYLFDNFDEANRKDFLVNVVNRLMGVEGVKATAEGETFAFGGAVTGRWSAQDVDASGHPVEGEKAEQPVEDDRDDIVEKVIADMRKAHPGLDINLYRPR